MLSSSDATSTLGKVKDSFKSVASDVVSTPSSKFWESRSSCYRHPFTEHSFTTPWFTTRWTRIRHFWKFPAVISLFFWSVIHTKPWVPWTYIPICQRKCTQAERERRKGPKKQAGRQEEKETIINCLVQTPDFPELT